MEEQDVTPDLPATGCYQCGANDGSMLRLCRSCLDANEHRRNSLKSSLTVDTDPKNNPLLFQFINSFAMQFGAIAALLIGITVPCVAVAITLEASVLSAMLIAVFLTAVIVAVFSWIFFWVNLLIDEAPCAIAALFVPIVAYRYAVLHWQETKYLFLFHIVSVVVAIGSVSTAVSRAIDFNSLRQQASGLHSTHSDRIGDGGKGVALGSSKQGLFETFINQGLAAGGGTQKKGASPNLRDIIKLNKALQAGGSNEEEIRSLLEAYGSGLDETENSD